MRELTPVQVLTIIAQRLEARAAALERIRLGEYDLTAHELQRFAAMVRKAREYLARRTRP